MTKTIQPCSWKTTVYVTDKDLRIKKPEEDNISLLLTLSNNLNTLHENLNSFNYMVKRYVNLNNKLVQTIYSNGKKGEKK